MTSDWIPDTDQKVKTRHVGTQESQCIKVALEFCWDVLFFFSPSFVFLTFPPLPSRAHKKGVETPEDHQ